MSGARSFLAAGIVGAVVWAFKREAERQQQTGQAAFIPASAPASTPASASKPKLDVGKLFTTLLGAAMETSTTTATPAQRSRTATVFSRIATPSTSKSAAGVDFGALERKYGLPTGYLYRTAQIESALNPNAKNPRSSAGGLFQFINSTAKAYGLTNRYDPQQASDAAARLARDNGNHLRKVLGREPTAAELYLAHQQGAGGASKILRDPNARAVDVVGSAAVRLNGGNSSMTAREFAGLWINKFNKGYV